MGKRGPDKQYPARIAVVMSAEQKDQLHMAAWSNDETVSEMVRRLVAKEMELYFVRAKS